MLSSQSVIDAERPGLGVGEGAVDPGQDDVGGHGADDVGLMPDVGGAGVGRPTVGFDRGDAALPDVLMELAACERRDDFSRPCGARFTDLAAR